MAKSTIWNSNNRLVISFASVLTRISFISFELKSQIAVVHPANCYSEATSRTQATHNIEKPIGKEITAHCRFESQHRSHIARKALVNQLRKVIIKCSRTNFAPSKVDGDSRRMSFQSLIKNGTAWHLPFLLSLLGCNLNLIFHF